MKEAFEIQAGKMLIRHVAMTEGTFNRGAFNQKVPSLKEIATRRLLFALLRCYHVRRRDVEWIEEDERKK